MSDLLARARGALLGLATGDALGTTLEFRRPGTFQPLDDLVGGGPFRLAPGQWTDDTSMALCLGASLIECRGFDAEDQMRRYVRWWRHGYFSSTGTCFDIGNTIRQALSRFEGDGRPYAGTTDPHTAANGSLMRLAPIPIFFAADRTAAIARAADSSRTTHAEPRAIDACRYFAALIVDALHGTPKDELLSWRWDEAPLHEEIEAVARGSFKEKNPPAIRGDGFVVRSLEAALWAFHRSIDFRSGALLAVNLGEDADTTGAIYGQIAGAHYGEIPDDWLAKLHEREMIARMAEELVARNQ